MESIIGVLSFPSVDNSDEILLIRPGQKSDAGIFGKNFHSTEKSFHFGWILSSNNSRNKLKQFPENGKIVTIIR